MKHIHVDMQTPNGAPRPFTVLDMMETLQLILNLARKTANGSGIDLGSYKVDGQRGGRA